MAVPRSPKERASELDEAEKLRNLRRVDCGSQTLSDLSVVICTHNPSMPYLQRVLEALRCQTLPGDRWELVIVDNASDVDVASRVDLAWHPRARVIVESQLGLTPARLRGMIESVAPVLVFVDDDNVLQSDYLEWVAQLAVQRPGLGAWGGCVTLRFDEPPPEWTQPHWVMLAMRHEETDNTSKDPIHWPSTPIGAGLCVRRQVAEHYRAQLLHDPWRSSLDRCGKSLMSAGDQDLMATACDLGMEKGVFPRLKVDHLIPPKRLIEDYLLRLNTAMEFSMWTFFWIRRPDLLPPRWTPRRWLKHARELLRLPTRERRFLATRMQGQRAALRLRRMFMARATPDEFANFIQAQGQRSVGGRQ